MFRDRKASLRRIPWTLILCLCGMACATAHISSPSGHASGTKPGGSPSLDRLNAVLWMQTAAEYRILAQWVYKSAERRLPELLESSATTAAMEQRAGFSALPPAVILDIDETVLDNSPFQASLIAHGIPYSEKGFGQWVSRAQAKAVPGSVEFIRECAKRGVVTFFVTNRDLSYEEATRRNLEAVGVSLSGEGVDRVLSNGEQEPGGGDKWSSDKTGRRAYLARKYRIIMLIGDDLGDFTAGSRDTPDKRIALAEQADSEWGDRWFLLPNAIYGSWESATYGNEAALSPERILQRKLTAIHPPD